MSKELIKLINDNPDLPIYAWVNADIVGDGYGWWAGQFEKAEIKEYAKVEPYGYYEKDYIFRDDYEEYLEFILDKYENLTEEEAIKQIENLEDYKQAIFAWIDVPDNF